MLSSRVRRLELSGIRKMFEMAAPGAINMAIGRPDFDPPVTVLKALSEAVTDGHNQYGPTTGLPALREAIARRYQRYDRSTGAKNVLVTVGGSEALAVAALTIYNPGDEVLIPNPGFVLYAPHARLSGAKPVYYSLRKELGFLPDLDELNRLRTHRTRAIVVNFPSNPTGALLPRKGVERLAAFANDHDLVVISDEVYDEFRYVNEPYASFWGMTEKAVVVNSFSKIFAITGWRAGYLVAPPDFVTQANKIHYYLVACPSTPVQIAALKGLESARPETRAMVREFRSRRDFLLGALKGVPGVDCVIPGGAFYAFPSIDWGLPDDVVAQELKERGLLCTPGSAFGTLGCGHLRLSFATSRGNLRKAVKILSAYGEEHC